MIRSLLLVALLAWPIAVAAQVTPRTIDDCEKIKEDMAYNQCLASFGPAARSGPARGAAGFEDAEQTMPAPVSYGRPRRGRGYYRQASRGRSFYARRGGRKRASFAIVSGKGRAFRARSYGGRRSGRRRR